MNGGASVSKCSTSDSEERALHHVKPSYLAVLSFALREGEARLFAFALEVDRESAPPLALHCLVQ